MVNNVYRDFDLLEAALDDEEQAWRRIHPEAVTPRDFGALKIAATQNKAMLKTLIRDQREYVASVEARDANRQTAAIIVIPVSAVLMFILGLWVGFLAFGSR